MNEVIDDLVSRYAEDTAFLWSYRNRATNRGDHKLSDLGQLDERLAAHIEGLHVSGISGWHYCKAGLEHQEADAAFAAAVIALEICDAGRIEQVLCVVDCAPQTIPGVASAFGWVAPAALRTVVSGMLGSQSPSRRRIALAACAMHQVDPGLLTGRRLEDSSSLVRARAIRAAGELGEVGMLPACVSALEDNDPKCRFWAAWSAMLLGDRDNALGALSREPIDVGAHRTSVFRLALQAMDVATAHRWLKALAANSRDLRWLIQSSGIVGDPTYIPWLISHMRQDKTARLAAEAFSLITGTDIGESEFGGVRPLNFESGPSDDPADPNVEIDPDEGLPWPNVEKIDQWWAANSDQFRQGSRYFMGGPITREHCIAVLKNGYQRQRTVAAQYLSLLKPGTPLFNTRAPAWRQYTALTAMS